QVRQSVVLAVGEGGGRRLVGYVVLEVGAAVSEAELKRQVSRQVPDYMVPGAVVRVEAVPLTANGKVDRRLLLAAAAEAEGWGGGGRGPTRGRCGAPTAARACRCRSRSSGCGSSTSWRRAAPSTTSRRRCGCGGSWTRRRWSGRCARWCGATRCCGRSTSWKAGSRCRR